MESLLYGPIKNETIKEPLYKGWQKIMKKLNE